MQIQLQVHAGSQVRPLDFTFDRIINGGYVGRDQAEVRRHIEELAEKGIPAPKTTPILIPVFCHTLTCAAQIEVFGHETSGEAEYVLFVKDEKDIYVGAGSDHTDRHLEETDIPRSKQLCPNVVSSEVWPLGEVLPHWDDLMLRSETVRNGQTIPYQQGALKLILSPADLIGFVRSVMGGPLKNMIIFSGTLATLTGEFVFGEQFSAELTDPVLDRRLSLNYKIDVLEPLTQF
jgi:hypothetical protein